jgi:hypothetical protein
MYSAVVLAILLLTTAGNAYSAELPIRDDESACLLIQTAVRSLGSAEGAQAEKLHLLAHDADSPGVEEGLQRILDCLGTLQSALRRVRLDRVAKEPSVENCLTLGYRALYEGQRLSSEVEKVLMEIRGYPLAEADQSGLPDPSP